MTKMTKLIVLSVIVFSLALYPVAADEGDSAYKTPDQIKRILRDLADQNKNNAQLLNLGKTVGDRDILLIELKGSDATAPAILVAANMEGNCPLATEAAVELTELLLTEWKTDLDTHRWFIMAVGNPDGYARFFDSPTHASFVNDRPVNDDKDDATGEDGPDDLNGDGFITQMRQLHPEGGWMMVEDNPVLMKKAETDRGEDGMYRLFEEGIDNDGDGRINEDGPGGANPGRNFPHNFRHFTTTNGLWAASENESRALLRFAFDHPEIAMVLTFGRANSLREVPSGSRGVGATQDSYKVPRWMARRMGVDPDKKFPLSELVEMAKEFTGSQDITEDQVLQWLGAGAATKPNKKDTPYWEEITKRYKDFIKEAGLNGKRLDPPDFSSGAVEDWAYYQFGVPSFAVDFWTVPVKEKEEKKETGALSPDEIEKMSNEEFIELGTEKIGEFLEAAGVGAQYTPEMTIQALQGGMITTKKIAEMARKKEKKEESGGADEEDQALYDYNPDAFVIWQEYDHPTLGKVEIGGKIPYADLAPPPAEADSLVTKQLPFIRTLAGLLPQVAIEKIEIAQRSRDVWEINSWVVNEGFLPYPTHQGERCQRPTPAVVTLDRGSAALLEGKERQTVGLLDGSGGSKKVSWLLQAGRGSDITISVNGFSAGTAEQTVSLVEGGK
ncbi:MAG: hypothetical protein JSU65_02065 [Candidatus Zixiibacteriota bacterium]|nr:MAG: hypothetical protein JSU65_02065 [candidate division Zixibacteria bacterium]